MERSSPGRTGEADDGLASRPPEPDPEGSAGPKYPARSGVPRARRLWSLLPPAKAWD